MCARNILGTETGCLMHELEHDPQHLLVPLVDLLRRTATLCIGTYDDAIVVTTLCFVAHVGAAVLRCCVDAPWERAYTPLQTAAATAAGEEALESNGEPDDGKQPPRARHRTDKHSAVRRAVDSLRALITEELPRSFCDWASDAVAHGYVAAATVMHSHVTVCLGAAFVPNPHNSEAAATAAASTEPTSASSGTPAPSVASGGGAAAASGAAGGSSSGGAGDQQAQPADQQQDQQQDQPDVQEENNSSDQQQQQQESSEGGDAGPAESSSVEEEEESSSTSGGAGSAEDGKAAKAAHVPKAPPGPHISEEATLPVPVFAQLLGSACFVSSRLCASTAIGGATVYMPAGLVHPVLAQLAALLCERRRSIVSTAVYILFDNEHSAGATSASGNSKLWTAVQVSHTTHAP